MCRLFPCIPIFFFSWGGGGVIKKWGMRDILRKHIDALFLTCFDG